MTVQETITTTEETLQGISQQDTTQDTAQDTAQDTTQDTTQDTAQDTTQDTKTKKEKFIFSFVYEGISEKQAEFLLANLRVKGHQVGKTETTISYTLQEIVNFGLHRNLQVDLERAKKFAISGDLKREDVKAPSSSAAKKTVEEKITSARKAERDAMIDSMRAKGISEETIQSILAGMAK